MTKSPQNPNGTYNSGDVDVEELVGQFQLLNNGATGGVTGPQGDPHTHPFTASGTSPSIDLKNLDVQYIDCILCSFDG